MLRLKRPSGLRRACAALAVLLGAQASAVPLVQVTESFMGATAPGWAFQGNNTDSGFLTASRGIDPAGNGWLRLTSNALSRNAQARLTSSSFTANYGVAVQFEYVSWGGRQLSGRGGDGLSFFLYDASKSMLGARNGASLGYCGGDGGYLGIGIDEFGNFAVGGGDALRCDPVNNTGGATVPQAVTVRGPTTGGAGGYNPFVSTSGTLPDRIDDPATTRPLSSRAKILLLPDGAGGYRINVQINQRGTGWRTVVNNAPYNYTPPASLSLGFSASTGIATNYHEVRNVEVRYPVDLGVTKTIVTPQSEIKYGADLTYQVVLSNRSASGYTLTADDTAKIPLTDKLPAALTGPTWTCVASSANSACPATSGTGDLNVTGYTLAAGDSLTYTVRGKVASPSPCTSLNLDNTAQVTMDTAVTPFVNVNSAVTYNAQGNVSTVTSQVSQQVSCPTLEVKKYVRNVTLASPFTATANTAYPQDTLQYCVSFSNPGGYARNFRITDSYSDSLNPATITNLWYELYSPASALPNVSGTTASPLTGTATLPNVTYTLDAANKQVTLNMNASGSASQPNGLPADTAGLMCFDAQVK